MEQQDRWLSLDEAANILKVGVPTLQSLLNRGIFTGQERDGQTVVSYAAILAFLRNDQRKLLEAGGQPPDQGLIRGAAEGTDDE
jgi:hypothetical protein